MNFDLLTTPNNRNITSNNGRHSIIAFDRHAWRQRKSVNGHRANHHAKTRSLRLGHVHIKVRDLNRSVPFYIRMLGLRLTEWVGRYAFLAAGHEHHSVALEEVGNWSVNPSRRAVGVAHIAFEVPDRAAFNAMQNKLRDEKVPFISGNNGTSWAFDFKDPDGNEIQIYVDRRHSPGGAELWKDRWYGPLKSEDEPAPFIEATATRDASRPALVGASS